METFRECEKRENLAELERIEKFINSYDERRKFELIHRNFKKVEDAWEL